MSTILLATRNKKKLVEMRRIMAQATGVEIIGLDDVPTYDEAPEDGATFEDNALLKAREAVAHTGFPAIADDSGLCVDAMSGMPGIFSARWSGRHGDDEGNLRLLLAQLHDVPDERRTGAFVCAAAYVGADGREVVIRDQMPGRIIREPRGAGGFGYDPIFVPDQDGAEVLTAAELSPDAKDRLSHRGKAMRRLAETLQEYL
ncbi:XTP/dITP diphosphohydrolase [Antricoccus suffuscus]|uniref:dITP/XTP pyrophosphatase n=1 Tax=Antricoccus suffuscus TaxID=1629062 RepID=A0A2T0Z2B1_9ACTN|nr:RdgB/HAM1 family non-canonical purine NTP pyrophosphatase [Antricoccus suffuscus]PRZ30499.1 XTP/dITP diphosphohydrolase [Antricoccus suffuscus]